MVHVGGRARAALGVVAGLVVLVAVGALVWGVNDWLWQREQVEILNALHDQDQLRIVQLEDSTAAAYRRLRAATGEKELLARLSEAQAADIKRLNLTVRQVYDLAVSYRDRYALATQAELEGDDTRIPIQMRDHRLWIDLTMWLRNHHVPAATRIDVEGEAGLDSLPVRVAVLEEPGTGGLIAQVTSSDPHVGVIAVEGVTDLRTTGVERKRRQLIDGFAGGVLVGAGGVGIVWAATKIVEAIAGD